MGMRGAAPSARAANIPCVRGRSAAWAGGTLLLLHAAAACCMLLLHATTAHAPSTLSWCGTLTSQAPFTALSCHGAVHSLAALAHSSAQEGCWGALQLPVPLGGGAEGASLAPNAAAASAPTHSSSSSTGAAAGAAALLMATSYAPAAAARNIARADAELRAAPHWLMQLMLQCKNVEIKTTRPRTHTRPPPACSRAWRHLPGKTGCGLRARPAPCCRTCWLPTGCWPRPRSS